MENIAGDLFDSLPEQCPGCGKLDSKAEDGPSKLMFLWQPLLSTYLCIDCNRSYTEWFGKNWTGTAAEYRESAKPKAVVNIEKIKAGQEPDYSQWSYNSPMNVNQHP
jgi:hypothetical protein